MSIPIDPVINPNDNWLAVATRVSACNNRPGLKKLYVTITDDAGRPLSGIKIRFDVEPSEGIAYDHLNIWGVTDRSGYLEWDHLGVPTRYVMWIEDDKDPLVENIRTDLGYEYCRPPGTVFGGWRPVNKPGVYSYKIQIQRIRKDA